MKEVRDLLMDCRIEFRKYVRDFHKTELCKRIDDVRDGLLHGPQPSAPAPVLDVEGADRVAQAWQGAAEDLRMIAPAFYELLAKKVAQRLAAMPAAAVDSTSASQSATATEVAAAQMAAMVVETEIVVHDATTATPSLMMVAVETHVPNTEVLVAIAASKRRFTEAQREWCVGEAMVRSGFSIDPEEFMARGDSMMAKFILESADE